MKAFRFLALMGIAIGFLVAGFLFLPLVVDWLDLAPLRDYGTILRKGRELDDQHREKVRELETKYGPQWDQKAER